MSNLHDGISIRELGTSSFSPSHLVLPTLAHVLAAD